MVLAYLLFSNVVDRILINLFGILVSSYALHVEVEKEKNPGYRAMCDFNDSMSCSRVLTSEYGRGFGVTSLLVGKEHFLNMRNCTLGIVFYSLQILMAVCPGYWSTQLLLYSSAVSILGSVYLAYILLFVLKDICVVCFTTYLVNGLLMYLNYSLYTNNMSKF
ncbi:hypothetical protein ScPMuIL_007079 [Solemya velum]